MQGGQALFECRGLRKSFGALVAVDGVSFRLDREEVLGIGGPNGAGKTTLFDLISGMAPADEGEMYLEGQPLRGLEADRICRLGLARTFQLNAGFDDLSVGENVAVAVRFGRGDRRGFRPGGRRETEERVEAALHAVGLLHLRDEAVACLPVFHRKLLMLAGAIATEPKLLLLDEPVGGLTPEEIDQVAKLLEGFIAAGMAVILIEHVMRLLVRLAGRIVILHQGRALFDGAPGGMIQEPAVVDVLLGEQGRRHVARYLALGEAARP